MPVGVNSIDQYLLLGLFVLRPSISSSLQSATAHFITKCDSLLLQSAKSVITKCDRLQSARNSLQNAIGITTPDYNVRQNTAVRSEQYSRKKKNNLRILCLEEHTGENLEEILFRPKL